VDDRFAGIALPAVQKPEFAGLPQSFVPGNQRFRRTCRIATIYGIQNITGGKAIRRSGAQSRLAIKETLIEIERRSVVRKIGVKITIDLKFAGIRLSNALIGLGVRSLSVAGVSLSCFCNFPNSSPASSASSLNGIP